MDELYRKKLEGLQRGSGAARPAMPGQTNMFQPNITDEESELVRQAQLMAVKNQPPPTEAPARTLQDLLAEQANFDAAMEELGEGQEVMPAAKPSRFQKLFNK